MKKIYNILAYSALALVTAFTSCKPLDSTFDGLGPKPVAIAPAAPTIASITLTASDYASLPPSNAAATAGFFHGTTDAFASIPSILANKYAMAGDKSQITVTYATSPPVPAYFKAADSTYTHITYTLVNSDYLKLPNNTFTDFSAAQILQWLPIEYPTPVDHQQVVLTFTYYDGATYTATQAFIYLNGAWKKAYLVTPAQYASVGRGAANAFVSADNNIPNILTSYFNTFLKSDPLITASAKIGDVQYVSYKYSTSERILPMAFDGTNWVSASTTATNIFTLSGGVWSGALDNTVYYTLSSTDFAAIATAATNNALTPPPSAAALADLNTHGDFTIEATATVPSPRWTDPQIAAGIAGVLKTKYTTPATNQKYLVTFKSFGGYPTETYTFNFDGTNFVYLPTPDNTKYTLTGDDYTLIATTTIPVSTGNATSAAMTNLNSFGDFSSAWTQDQINAGIALVLKGRYATPTANQAINVTYAIYNGGNVTTNKVFTWNGTAFVGQ